MSELQQYYDAFRTGYWAHPEKDECPCHGSGWALSDVDTWHECPIHYHGQIHPEVYCDMVSEGLDPDDPANFEPAPEPAPVPAVEDCDDIPF